jgi:DNA-binding NtrC family response regulator
MKILVLDDQRSARRVLRQMLGALEDVEILEASSVNEAIAVIEMSSPDLLLLDIRLADDPRDRGGLEVLRTVRASGRSTPAVIVTSSTELAEIREAMRHGAQDYVLKDDLSPEMLLPIIEGMRERLNLRGEVTRLRERVDKSWGTAAIIGSSLGMDRVRRLVARVADAGCAVLIRGETGSGKEIVARALHESSGRRDQPFIAVNCSALPGALIESLIFWHDPGPLTQLEIARGGTLLLDEIAEMPAELQAKLLRVLEDRRFRPLGAETEIPVRARIIAATHVDLERRIAEGRFREDLYYRLNVVTIDIPPLSDRGNDLVELLLAFCSELPRRIRFTDEAVAWLSRRRWSGNVRELRNVIERVALLSETDVVDIPVLEELVRDRSSGDWAADIERIAKKLLALPPHLGSKLEVIERAIVQQAIEMADGNKSAAARILGLDRKALERKWERLSGETPATEPADDAAKSPAGDVE